MEEQKELRENLRLLARSSFIVFIGLALSKIIIYLYRIITARYFGPEVYGLFSLAMMISTLFASFSAFGLSEGLLRYVSLFLGRKQTERVRYSVRTVATIVSISSIIAGIVLFFFAEIVAIRVFHDTNLVLFLRIFAFGVPLAAIANVLLSTLRAYEEIHWFSFITNILRNLIKLLLLIVFIALGVTSSGVALSYVLGLAIMLLVSYFVMKYKIAELWLSDNLPEKERKKTARAIVAYSLPLVFVAVIQSSIFWADSLFLGYFKTTREVGFYAAALPIATLLSVVPELFMQLFFPMITKHYARKDIDLTRDLTKQIMKWIVILNLPLFILIFIFPDIALKLLFGDEYMIAANALRLLAGSIFIASVFSTISYHLLLSLGKSRLILFNSVAAMILSILMNYFLIPLGNIGPLNNVNGLSGAALAALLTSVFLTTLIIIETRFSLRFIPLHKKTVRVIFVGLVLAFALFYIRHNLLESILSISVASILFLIVYSILILVTRCLDTYDYYILHIIKNKIGYRVRFH